MPRASKIMILPGCFFLPVHVTSMIIVTRYFELCNYVYRKLFYCFNTNFRIHTEINYEQIGVI